MTKKPFSPGLFKENDNLARAAGKKYWSKLGYEVWDNPDRYGPDLIVNNEFYCETEIKRVWKGPEFPYDTLQIAGRKQKFLDSELPCVFMVCNDEQTHAIIATEDEVRNSPLVEVPNRYVHKGEYFYQVPVTKVVQI
jgi:hypothetical protein